MAQPQPVLIQNPWRPPVLGRRAPGMLQTLIKISCCIPCQFSTNSHPRKLLRAIPAPPALPPLPKTENSTVVVPFLSLWQWGAGWAGAGGSLGQSPAGLGSVELKLLSHLPRALLSFILGLHRVCFCSFFAKLIPLEPSINSSEKKSHSGCREVCASDSFPNTSVELPKILWRRNVRV